MNLIKIYRKNWTSIALKEEKVYTIGWAEYHSKILSSDQLAGMIMESSPLSFDSFNNLLKKLNGNFSVIFQNDNEVFIGTDRMRGYPIIYFSENNDWIITDDIMQLQDSNDKRYQIDANILEQYLVSDYVFGPYTVYKNIYSIQAGEAVRLTYANPNPERLQYFKWIPNMAVNQCLDLQNEAAKQDKVFISVFQRMIDSAPGVNNWLIPLSGGYDSRIIVNYLYKMGIKNVICFSYGMKGNIQSEISKKVAEALGFDWYFIDFKEWIPLVLKSIHIEGYLKYGFNGVSEASFSHVPFMFALLKMGVAKENDIVVPGHALEVLAGNHLDMPSLKYKRLEDTLRTLKRHYSGFGYYTKKRIAVEDHVLKIVQGYNLEPAQVPECFDWQERQTKFIANSVKVYEYFNVGWRIPEWDLELFNYWKNISFEHRFERNMFKSIFKEYLAVKELKNIQIANEIRPTATTPFNIKDRIVNSTPVFVKKLIKSFGLFPAVKYSNEGYRLIYSNTHDTIKEYCDKIKLPENCQKYLEAYPENQEIRALNVNSNVTLMNLKKIMNK